MPAAARRPAFASSRAWLFAAMLGFFALALAGRAEAAFVPPPLHSHVVDTAGRLSAADVAAIDRKLAAFRVQYGFEIVAFVTGSLEGENIGGEDPVIDGDPADDFEEGYRDAAE